MIGTLKNIITRSVYTPVNATVEASGRESYNRYENPFVQPASATSYGVNKPVRGGYFAGYYNGKPNIVGRKLFIEA